MPQKKSQMQLVQILFEDAQTLDITGPIEVFSQANWISSEKDATPDPAYDIITVSEKKGPVTMSSGIQLVADCSFDDYFRADSEEKMRRAFKRQLNVLPKEYRNRFGW